VPPKRRSLVATLTKNSFSSKKKLQPRSSRNPYKASSGLVRFWEAILRKGEGGERGMSEKSLLSQTARLLDCKTTRQKLQPVQKINGPFLFLRSE